MISQILCKGLQMKVECEREDCRIVSLGSYTTCLGWTPIYDKHGNLLNSDPNKITTEYKCTVCGNNWIETKQNVGI